ncbi:MAG: glycerate kinase [Bacteroidetes bacterium]|nr:glycerate kinase [Bacteroidota bacterium]
MQQPFFIFSRACADLGSTELASLAAKQIRAAFKTMRVHQFPLVSGETGTMEQLVTSSLGSFLEVEATAASGEQLIVPIGFTGETGTLGIIEMIAVARRPDEPLFRRSGKGKHLDHLGSTFGVGELIRDVLDEGAHSVLLGWEEPLARDAGFGMAQALGVKFFDKNGKELDFRGETSLHDVASLDLSGRSSEQLFAKFYLMRSESIPAPKRTQQLSVDDLVYEQELTRIAEILRRDLGLSVPNIEIDYSGSCIEFGASVFLNAEIKDGATLAFEVENLPMRLASDGGTAIFFAEQLEDVASEKAPASSKQVMQWLEEYHVPTVVITNQSFKSAAETRYKKKYSTIQSIHALADVPLFFEPLAPDAPADVRRRYLAARLEKLFMRIGEGASVGV